MRRMMERYCESIMRRLLTLVTMVFLALMFLGCNDSMVKDMEAQRQEVGFMVEQELQRCRYASRVTRQAVPLPQARAADMDAERRELDRMVERGDWQSLLPMPPTSQAEVFHPAP
jgi:hypothetical protein